MLLTGSFPVVARSGPGTSDNSEEMPISYQEPLFLTAHARRSKWALENFLLLLRTNTVQEILEFSRTHLFGRACAVRNKGLGTRLEKMCDPYRLPYVSHKGLCTSPLHCSEHHLLSLTDKCVALKFKNSVGSQIKLLSSLKRDGWLINGEEFKMNFTFKRPELHKFISFKAIDTSGRFKIFLDGDTSISVMPSSDCSTYIDVLVTGIEGRKMSK